MNSSVRIHSVALRVRRTYETNDPLEIAQERGLSVVFSSLTSPVGMYVAPGSESGGFIILSNSLDDRMTRVVAAHELGHELLHRELAARSGFFSDETLSFSGAKTEYEANCFAAHLLLDSEEVFDAARENGYDVCQLASVFDVCPELMSIKIAEMVTIGYKLRLPEQVRPDFLKTVAKG
ncbi:MAG: ImmA/IrrE family metallo-endopeptidase [Clostridia bacterium]|nr:ImmA/IrrE family metallo-endopeptidase [Clostridia bacterium]